MKKTVIVATFAALMVNISAGLILSIYHPFNLIATSIAILLTGFLILLAESIKLKDAFRVSFPFLFVALGIVMFLLMLFSKHQIKDNWSIIVSLIIFAIEVLLVYVTYKVTIKTIRR